jgi:hypothetical protein
MGGGGNDVLKCTNTNEIQKLFAGYQKLAKLGKHYVIFFPMHVKIYAVL